MLTVKISPACTKVADTLALFSLISSSLRDGRSMPVSVPLMERMAGLSIHTAQDQLELYRVKLNWKSLQVSVLAFVAVVGNNPLFNPPTSSRFTERADRGLRHNNRCAEQHERSARSSA